MMTQVEGGKPETVHAGEAFYESPTDIHIAIATRVRRNPQSFLSSL
jgi:hypothetical protein